MVPRNTVWVRSVMSYSLMTLGNLTVKESPCPESLDLETFTTMRGQLMITWSWVLSPMLLDTGHWTLMHGTQYPNSTHSCNLRIFYMIKIYVGRLKGNCCHIKVYHQDNIGKFTRNWVSLLTTLYIWCLVVHTHVLAACQWWINLWSWSPGKICINSWVDEL